MHTILFMTPFALLSRWEIVIQLLQDACGFFSPPCCHGLLFISLITAPLRWSTVTLFPLLVSTSALTAPHRDAHQHTTSSTGGPSSSPPLRQHPCELPALLHKDKMNAERSEVRACRCETLWFDPQGPIISSLKQTDEESYTYECLSCFKYVKLLIQPKIFMSIINYIFRKEQYLTRWLKEY